MSKKTVRVEIPKGQPDRLIQLAKDIMAKHGREGANSPLDPGKLSRLEELVSKAAGLHAEARLLAGRSHAATESRNDLLGIGVDQVAASNDTVLNLVTYVRDQLAIHHRRNEQQLSDYGFEVTLGAARRVKSVPAQGGVAAV